MSVESVRLWTVVGALALGTMAYRLSFIELFGRLDAVPPRLVAALRFVPPAVLAALVAPAFAPASLSTAAVLHPVPTAGLLAAVVAWRTGNVLATLAAGMATFWLLRPVLG